ncbi:MAG: response regulator [Bacteroidota bacterium]
MKTILVIEDEESIRKNIIELLEVEDFRTLEAENGLIGIDQAKRHHPDLILSDVMMPERNGFEVLSELQQEKTTARIPFIFLTAKTDQNDFRRGMEIGADDYIAKPFTNAVLLKAIHQRFAKAESQEQFHRDRLRALLEHSLDTIAVISPEGIVDYVTPSSGALWGWSFHEVQGKNIFSLVHREDLAAFRSFIAESSDKNKSGASLECRWNHTDGSVKFSDVLAIDLTAEPAVKGIVVTIRDITERKKNEEKMMRVQRLENIGFLSSGIAHDLNNVLSPVLLSVQLLLKDPSRDRSQKILNNLVEIVTRGIDLVKQVTVIAKGMERKHHPIQAKYLLREMKQFVEQTFPDSISVMLDYDNDLWLIKGDTTQIHQILLNLCINARDAMQGGGTIRLDAHNTLVDAPLQFGKDLLEPGAYVTVSVSDSGAGMSAEVMARIFDPFFTTKGKDSGTGLGLATVANIVQQHKAYLSVKSAVNDGTTFSIMFHAEQIKEEVTEKKDELISIPVNNTEGILFIDDEAVLHDISRLVLENYGYKVFSAFDGAEGIATYLNHKDEIHLAIVDMRMPIMNGIATTRALMKINPSLPIIAASATNDEQVKEVLSQGAKEFIVKPFSVENVLSTIYRILHGPADSN